MLSTPKLLEVAVTEGVDVPEGASKAVIVSLVRKHRGQQPFPLPLGECKEPESPWLRADPEAIRRDREAFSENLERKKLFKRSKRLRQWEYQTRRLRKVMDVRPPPSRRLESERS